MGQKTHPYGFRLKVIRGWSSKWYEDKHYAKWLHEDLKLRKAIRSKFANAGIASISTTSTSNSRSPTKRRTASCGASVPALRVVRLGS